MRSVERQYAKAEGNAGLAGNYAGLAIGPTLPASHCLGEPVETWFGDGDTVLLGCVRGDPGCWPLTAGRGLGIHSDVKWFPHRLPGLGLSGVGPFTFERPAYEAALAKVYPMSRASAQCAERAHLTLRVRSTRDRSAVYTRHCRARGVGQRCRVSSLHPDRSLASLNRERISNDLDAEILRGRYDPKVGADSFGAWHPLGVVALL